MSFASLGLSEPILRAVAERGYTEPTPIQIQAIPVVLAGGDLLGGAQTGTGKTAGFTLPILQRLSTTPPVHGSGKRAPIRALILTPTRELAAQVEESVREYGRHLDLKSMVMFGGVGFQPQASRLRERVDILVATPGRLLDHAGQKTVDLSAVEILVLDEADRMLDMGFIRDIRKVLAMLPKRRQNLLFSATFSDEIRSLADGLLDRPATVEVARRNTPTELVDQRAIAVEKGAKRLLLAHLLRTRQWTQVLVFTRTKHGANRLAEQLSRDGLPALAIHGNKSQGARTRALSQFKEGNLQVLVATDIAARGLDIIELPVVVNFELPNVPEDYVHRIGRTGRAGCNGIAVSLVGSDEKTFLADIEKLLRRPIPRETVADFDMAAALAASRAAAQDRPATENVRSDSAPKHESRQRRTAEGTPRGERPQRNRDSERRSEPAAERHGGDRSARPAQGNRADQRQGQRDRTGNRQPGAARTEPRRVDSGARSDPARRRPPAGQALRQEVRPEERTDDDSRGNRALPPRQEVDGNRAPPPPQDVDGNRVPSSGATRSADDNRGNAKPRKGIRGAFSQAIGVLRRMG
ncbi:MAG: DEAD/DEAH box helicase [Betaproteobacteria bacterium]|nr:DEAD/DEAH box helicase [Betaproteobacteria bacterium]